MMSILYNFTFDPDRKNLYTIYKDLSHLKKKRFAKKSYFTNLMYKKSAGNIDDYVDKKAYDRIKYNYYRLDKKHPVLEEKIIFQKHLQKSTRLNSSHVSISYAVFCLKKKRIIK